MPKLEVAVLYPTPLRGRAGEIGVHRLGELCVVIYVGNYSRERKLSCLSLKNRASMTSRPEYWEQGEQTSRSP